MQNQYHGGSAGVRAIVIDDDELVLDVLTRMLEMRGYEVFAYSDPSEFHACKVCVDAAVRLPCADILITDVNMPVVNGLTFVKGLRENNCPIAHTAAVSGLWAAESRAHALRLGCRVFAKPIDFSMLNPWLDECDSSVPAGRKLMAPELLEPVPHGTARSR